MGINTTTYVPLLLWTKINTKLKMTGTAKKEWVWLAKFLFNSYFLTWDIATGCNRQVNDMWLLIMEPQ